MEVKIPETVNVVELEKAPFKCAREAIAYAKSHGIVGVMSAADSGVKGRWRYLSGHWIRCCQELP